MRNWIASELRSKTKARQFRDFRLSIFLYGSGKNKSLPGIVSVHSHRRRTRAGLRGGETILIHLKRLRISGSTMRARPSAANIGKIVLICEPETM